MAAAKERGQRRVYCLFCPWAACMVSTVAALPGGLDHCRARKYQLTCSGCRARLAAARATCAFCHQPPQAGCAHTQQDTARGLPRAASPGPIGARVPTPPGGPPRAKPRLPCASPNALRFTDPLGARRPRAGSPPWLTVGLERPETRNGLTGGPARTPTSVDAASMSPRLLASAPTPRVTSGPPGANSVDMQGGLTTPAASVVTRPGSAASPAPWPFKPRFPSLLWLGLPPGASPSPPTSAAWT